MTCIEKESVKYRQPTAKMQGDEVSDMCAAWSSRTYRWEKGGDRKNELKKKGKSFANQEKGRERRIPSHYH